jgi:hypothetical protein
MCYKPVNVTCAIIRPLLLGPQVPRVRLRHITPNRCVLALVLGLPQASQAGGDSTGNEPGSRCGPHLLYLRAVKGIS